MKQHPEASPCASVHIQNVHPKRSFHGHAPAPVRVVRLQIRCSCVEQQACCIVRLQIRCSCVEQHAARGADQLQPESLTGSPLLILFSGGVDSTLLAALAHQVCVARLSYAHGGHAHVCVCVYKCVCVHAWACAWARTLRSSQCLGLMAMTVPRACVNVEPVSWTSRSYAPAPRDSATRKRTPYAEATSTHAHRLLLVVAPPGGAPCDHAPSRVSV